MKKETYIKMTQPFRMNAKAGRAIHIINKILTYSVFIAYPILLLYLLLQRNPILGRAIIVPLDSFEREYRERLGRLLCEIAAKAERVERIVCGIGQRIK